MDMGTLKTMYTTTRNAPRTAITTMVQPLVMGTIFIFLTMQMAILILTFIVVCTAVPTVTIIFGPEINTSAQVR